MAKSKTFPGFAEISTAMREMPDLVARETVATHRDVWREFRDRDGYPGLRQRFQQGKPSSAQPGKHAQWGGYPKPGVYFFSGRRHQIPPRPYAYRGHVRTRDPRPSYVRSGAMRDELLRREVRSRRSKGQVSTNFTLYSRSINLWGPKNGIRRIVWQPAAVSYMTTVYTGPGGAADRSGPEQRLVTRTVMQAMVTRATTTYEQEWGWKDDELAWIVRRIEDVLHARLATLTMTPKGKIKTAYKSQFKAAKRAK